MANGTHDGFPQVVAIASLYSEGKLSFVKRVRQELADGGDTFYVQVGDEVVVSAQPIEGSVPAAFTGRYLVLPDAVRMALGIEAGEQVAIVQRAHGVALKRVAIEERTGDHAAAFDVETSRRITRVVQANPEPDAIVPQLQARYHDLALRHEVKPCLRNRDTLAAWHARQILQAQEAGDENLRGALVEERLAGQDADGSWAGDVVGTARQLYELAELGLSIDELPIRRGVGWLVARPESDANPGMWFGSDELVAKQADVLAQRKAGLGGRYREIRAAEQRRVMRGHELIRAPCGPRIMWPNALVLRSLLHVGLEGNERVQRALQTMTLGHDWCECGFQHGLTSWRRSEPLNEDELEAFEDACMRQFRYGGLASPNALLEADLAHRAHQLRIDCHTTPHGSEYALRTPDHIQGCEFVTTYALSEVQDERAQHYARAHLWRFAGIQRADGTFPRERHGTGFTPIGILGLFACYDHPAATIVLMRALPWIVATQNADGSWGKGERADASTLTVLRALHRLKPYLPELFLG
jgi:bifunctional DNA-binding transcriptional regulator/antitoxin component of YhaV-PrlF toxin-antitoxin module